MKIKHYVITRFLTFERLGFGDKIFDDSVILDSIGYVKENFIPTLNNQSSKNFEIIFLVNDKHDIENSSIRLLYDLDTNIPVHIVKYSQLNNFLTENTKDADFLITTRMDYDDLVYYDAANEIQEICLNNAPQIGCYGYIKGTLLRNDKTYEYIPNYTKGYFSVFLSFIVNLHTVGVYNVYQLNDHTKVKEQLINICKNIGLEYRDEMLMKAKRDKYYFVWCRHKNTASSLLKYPKEDSYWDEVEIPNFEYLFGKKIKAQTSGENK